MFCLFVFLLIVCLFVFLFVCLFCCCLSFIYLFFVKQSPGRISVTFTGKFNPRPPEVFFVALPPRGVVATPSLGFLYRTPDSPVFVNSVQVWTSSIYWYQNEYHWTSYDLSVISYSQRTLRNLNALKIYMKISDNQFLGKKIVETWDFCRIFGWIWKDMMILIYIASLKHKSCQIFKEMDKIRIIGFHQLRSIIFFDDPIPKRYP